MSATDTMRWMGRSARHRAETLGHTVKGRTLERRLSRTADEAERLRMENQMLREEVDRERDDHRRMLDLLERHVADSLAGDTGKSKRRRGRWFLFLTALAGGAYALSKMRSQAGGRGDWDETGAPALTDSAA
jgi:hypothetical protein